MRFERIVCWEALDVTDPMVQAAGRLYEQTLDPDERIPWYWIERSVAERAKTKPGGWTKHLILAAPEGKADDPASLAGFVYGALIPGYGGYLCYVGVALWARRMGVGSRLYDQFFRVLQVDAGETGDKLPFVVWESHRPGPDAPPEDRELWNARVRLFDRVGGLWVEGVDFLAPNFAEDDGDPVPLQLFVKPVDLPASAFTGERLRALIGGLHERVYRNEPDEPLFDEALPPSCELRLVPAKQAAAVRADRGVLV
jgi:hypothetical protein